MSDAMERYCTNCAYYDNVVGCQNPPYEACINYSMHKFPEEINQTVAAINKLEKTLSLRKDQGKFSLDKLIDDHWQYNEDFASYLIPYDRAEWETSDILALVEFSYKAAFRHGFKHAMEHYGIEEKNDE